MMTQAGMLKAAGLRASLAQRLGRAVWETGRGLSHGLPRAIDNWQLWAPLPVKARFGTLAERIHRGLVRPASEKLTERLGPIGKQLRQTGTQMNNDAVRRFHGARIGELDVREYLRNLPGPMAILRGRGQRALRSAGDLFRREKPHEYW